MNQNTRKKRVTIKLKKPNPLFEKWLQEWYEQAKEHDSKMQHCFSLALKTLRKYPLPLEKGSDCKILKGFGDKLCKMLDNKLESYKKGDIPDDIADDPEPPKKRQNTEKRPIVNKISPKNDNYLPQVKSGAYAILLALHNKSFDLDYPGYLTKAEIIKFGQHLSDKSFTKADVNTRYTAWSSMRTLETKQLVKRTGHPPKFSLTDRGAEIALKLKDIEQQSNSCASTSNSNSQIVDNDLIIVNDDLICNGTEKEISKSKSDSIDFLNKKSSTNEAGDCLIVSANNFDIILYVDTQETCGKTDVLNDPLLFELNKLKTKYEVKNLKIGDYAWICRDKDTKKELILPYIVERKRMDDFACSIKDGRYHEQKFRLKRSGIQNITYLIESYGKNDKHVGLPLSTLYQAATNTAVQDGFNVKLTASLEGTAHYLNCFTKLLINKFRSKTLCSCKKQDLPELNVKDDLVSLMFFDEFNAQSSKNKDVSVRDMFVRMLIQIHGMSVEKALAVVEEFKTPRNLFETLKEIGPTDGEKLLANIKFGALNKALGPIASKTIYQLFVTDFHS